MRSLILRHEDISSSLIILCIRFKNTFTIIFLNFLAGFWVIMHRIFVVKVVVFMGFRS